MRPDMRRVFIGGSAGTMLITLMTLFVSPFVRGGPMDVADMLGDLLSESWIAGVATHLIMGMVVLPTLYGLIVYRMVRGIPAVRGMIWGLMLWLVSQIVLVPALGGGLFSTRVGGIPGVIGSLLGNLVYGLVLGVLAGHGHEGHVRDEEELRPEVYWRRASQHR